jgi:hypothetical protein
MHSRQELRSILKIGNTCKIDQVIWVAHMQTWKQAEHACNGADN